MSHTTTVNNVEIKDVGALMAAVDELKANGINCDLLENQIPRAFYQTQAGMTEAAPYTLKLRDSRYDVGFYPNAQGVYEARCDLWGGDIAKQLGVTPTEGIPSEQAALGKLFNLYSVHAVTRKAAQQGYRVQRSNAADGSVQLNITGNM